MSNFLRYIPGFRSDTTWKKAVASIYYIIALLMFIGEWVVGLFLLASPFLIFSFIDLIFHRKIGFTLKRTLIPFILSFTLFITSVAIMGETDTKEQGEALTQPNILVENDSGQDEKNQKEPEGELEKPEEKLEEESEEEPEEPDEQKEELEEQAEQVEDIQVEGKLEVHYIDVGQGDCALVKAGDNAMLVDTGDRGYGDGIVSYLKNQNVESLDYLILTHPHADHIGGAVEVINAFSIGKIIMPKVSHTSKTFENVIITVKNKGMKFTTPNLGDEYPLGSANFSILGPSSSDYKNLNDYSVVNRVAFGNTSFLFTGDAESISENQIVNSGLNAKADVLKVGHHGSDTSTTESFLKAVDPTYAVISCGAGNKYGHPTQIILARLDSYNVNVYRTDELGTIIATSDGNAITFDKGASPIKQNAPPSQGKSSEPKQQEAITEDASAGAESDNVEVYVTKSGTKYHKGNCTHLRKSKIPKSLDEAKASGYEPCKTCSPPK